MVAVQWYVLDPLDFLGSRVDLCISWYGTCILESASPASASSPPQCDESTGHEETRCTALKKTLVFVKTIRVGYANGFFRVNTQAGERIGQQKRLHIVGARFEPKYKFPNPG